MKMRTNTLLMALLTLLIVSAMCATAAATEPTAVITTTDTWGEAPYSIYFSGYYSNDPDGTIVSYDWAFGDGNTSTEDDGEYVYTEPGNYTMSLMVTDNDEETGWDYENITIVPGDDPIRDNGMKAYVWNSAAEPEWNATFDAVIAELSGQGFEVVHHIAPSPNEIYQAISDPNVKVYWGAGHGADTYAGTGNGIYYATPFGDTIESRGYPITIGIFNHCGNYSCYTPGTWLQESTQGNDDVVANRFFGTGWCGDTTGSGGTISTLSWDTNTLIAYLGFGYTYSDAVDRVNWVGEEGRKQGNQDLRYPQFCGDVDYDMVVDPADAALLQNHIADPGAYPVHSEWDADVNGDGNVDAYDANLLELHVNNPAEYRLKPIGWFAGHCIWYDTNGEPGIQLVEAWNAVLDYQAGIISEVTAQQVLDCYYLS